jgi:drug/metabolite transporter (DMT)-like permease
MIILFSVLIGVLSALAYGSANAFSQPLSKKYGASVTLFLRGVTIVPVLGVASLLYGHYPAHWLIAILALALGMVGYLPVLAFTHAIKESPIGIVAPIAGTSPLVTVLLSFIFLGLKLHPAQWAAIIAIIVASIAISFNVKNWRETKANQLSQGVVFAVLASLGWGLFFFLLILVTRHINSILAAFLIELGVTGGAGVHSKLSGRSLNMVNAKDKHIIVNGLLICVGTVAFTLGVKYYNVGIVAALSNSTAIVASILGVYLYHERLKTKERLAAAFMIAGVIVISVF